MKAIDAPYRLDARARKERDDAIRADRKAGMTYRHLVAKYDIDEGQLRVITRTVEG